VPDRPRYVVLCNFDELWIYDFETDLDTPKDKLPLADLPRRWGPLAFLAGKKPSFESDREAVTRDAADKLAKLFSRLVHRGVERYQIPKPPARMGCPEGRFALTRNQRREDVKGRIGGDTGLMQIPEHGGRDIGGPCWEIRGE